MPPDVETLLRTVQGQAAKKLPSFPDQLRQLDAAEQAQSGGIPHWVTHAAHYDYASEHAHPSIHGSLTSGGGPFELLGFQALTYGFQYFALGADALLRLTGVEKVRHRLLQRYAAIKPVKDAELQRLL